MNVLVLGATYQQGIDWIRRQRWSLISTVQAMPASSDFERVFRGTENFILILVGSYWDRPDAQRVYELAISRPGVLVMGGPRLAGRGRT